ncbi:hypothetical protein HOD20_06605 [archaeon]|jgi:hypothetical protein|nr:hypothetical protein [archaeon]
MVDKNYKKRDWIVFKGDNKSKKMLLFSLIFIFAFVFFMFIFLSDFVNDMKLVGYAIECDEYSDVCCWMELSQSYERSNGDECESDSCEHNIDNSCDYLNEDNSNRGYGFVDGGNDNNNNNNINDQTTECNDDMDNDGDCLIDEKDPGCWKNVEDPLSYDSSLDSEIVDGLKSIERRNVLGIFCCNGDNCSELNEMEIFVEVKECGEWNDCFLDYGLDSFSDESLFMHGFKIRECILGDKKFIERENCDTKKVVKINKIGSNVEIRDLDDNLISDLELIEDYYNKLNIKFY